MIVSLSTLLSRAKRNTQAAPIFAVTSPELIEAVCLAVHHKRSRAILLLEGGHPNSDALVSYAMHTAHTTDGDIAVTIRTDPSQEHIMDALTTKAPGIWISRHHLSEEHYTNICRWGAKQAFLHGAASIGESGVSTLPLLIEELVKELQVSVLAVPLTVMRDGEHVLDRHQLHAATRKARIPLVGLYQPLSERERRICSQEGITGLYQPPKILNEPYTAGLYTGLRDRSQSDPAIYARYARKAAAEAAGLLL